MAAHIGIDLGTTFSAVAIIDEVGRPRIVHNKDGQNITPSCILFQDNGVALVGEEARRAWGIGDKNAHARWKRSMGDSVTHQAQGREFTPTDLSQLVLEKLLHDTKEKIHDVGEAVVTIPANFSHAARDCTMTAAKKAGLNVKYIINEPTAAALYYALDTGKDLGGIYAVYDMGGGTFDISIIRMHGRDVEVLATNGIAKLGGDDFDRAVQRIVQEKFKKMTGEDLEQDDFSLNDAEQEKISLSKRDTVAVRIARKMIEIKRTEFEEAISSLIMQAEILCETSIKEAEVNISDIKGVLMAGGSTRLPTVMDSIKRIFKQEPVSTANVDEVVALGAALYSAYKGDQESLTAAQRIAINKIKISETTSQCFGTICLDDKDRLKNQVLISKGDKIPCSVTDSVYTRWDGQESVDCQVTESIAPETDPKFVKVIWKGELQLPPGRPEGQEIQITYAYDENQIMSCSFLDVETKRETRVDLSMSKSENKQSDGIDKFIVE